MPCFNIVRQRSLYFDLLVHYHSTSVVIYSKWGRGTGTTAERTRRRSATRIVLRRQSIGAEGEKRLHYWCFIDPLNLI